MNQVSTMCCHSKEPDLEWPYWITDCKSKSKKWLVKSYQTSIAFGCVSCIIQCLNFEFPDTNWGDRDNITLTHDLQVLQNKATKVILDLPNYASSTTLGWPTLSQEHLVRRYITTFKYIHRLVDHNFNTLRNSNIQSYKTRRRNTFCLPLAKRNYGKQTFLSMR